MFKNLILISISSLFLLSCAAFKPEKVDTRETPVNAEERARKNIEEGRGVSIKGLLVGVQQIMNLVHQTLYGELL